VSALGPTYATSFHGVYEYAPSAVDDRPGGRAWREALEAERPEGERHLAVHEGHLCHVTDRDRPLVDAAGPAILSSGWAGDAAAVAARVAEAGATGFTEIAYMPAGPDIPAELTAFAIATQPAPRSG
jgi:5,10-methylenetetrahydromethanopterin reductase